MTLNITGGRVEVYKPTNSSGSPNIIIEPPDLQSVTVEQEVQAASGSASITIDNDDGAYAGDITAGDRLEFVVTMGGEVGDVTLYGDGTYGSGTYGARSGTMRRWTGMASIPRYRFRGVGNRSLTISAQPFVGAVMGSLGRKVDNAFRGEQVDEIARTIINDEAEELDPSGIEEFPDTAVDIEFDGTPLLSAMKDLADEADAVLTGRGTTVILRSLAEIPMLWSATVEDFGTWDVDDVDDELWNQIRVEGGTDNDEGDTQTTQTSYTTVTEGSPLKTQLNLPKSRIDQVDLWTKTTGAEETLTVAIQEDKGGAPTAINDPTKDLAKKDIPHEILDDDGFTTFLLEYTELPAANPWLIVRSDGSEGIDIGTNDSGTLTYRAYYPYPIITQQSDQDSIDEYRRREHRIGKDNITTARAAASTADRTLRRHADPRGQFEANALSSRAHKLQPAAAIKLDFPEETAVGSYMVTGRTDNYAPSKSSRNLLETDVRLEEIESF